jgi:hypothetical protein
MMLSLEMGHKLKRAGLKWQPMLHDFFTIPERGFGGRLFVITDMFANIERLLGSPVVAFQGASEWALDYLITTEAVWMPSEEQLRRLILERLEEENQSTLSLICRPESCRCEFTYRGQGLSFEMPEASDAYASGLLHLLSLDPPIDKAEDEAGADDDIWNQNITA